MKCEGPFLEAYDRNAGNNIDGWRTEQCEHGPRI